jgi:hypothetical protein
MKNHVLCYAVPVPFLGWSNVLLMGTDTHNLPAGEMGDDEMPEVAAARVLRNVGITVSLPDTRVMGVIQHTTELVHVCHCPFRVGEEREGPAVVGSAFWVPLEQAMKSEQVLHAAKVAVALSRSGLTNWAFSNNGPIVGLNLEGWQ